MLTHGLTVAGALQIAESENLNFISEEDKNDFEIAVVDFVDHALSSIAAADSDESMERAIHESFRRLATMFFSAGALWQTEDANGHGDEAVSFGLPSDNRQVEEGPDFTVVVDTIPFVAKLINNGSVTFRFALENEDQEDQ